jgi:hypothetical protein
MSVTVRQLDLGVLRLSYYQDAISTGEIKPIETPNGLRLIL